MFHLLTWRRCVVLPVLQPATRGLSKLFGFTFGKHSFCSTQVWSKPCFVHGGRPQGHLLSSGTPPVHRVQTMLPCGGYADLTFTLFNETFSRWHVGHSDWSQTHETVAGESSSWRQSEADFTAPLPAASPCSCLKKKSPNEATVCDYMCETRKLDTTYQTKPHPTHTHTHI